MLLCDVGNTRMHIYDGKKVYHISMDEAFEKFDDEYVRYISVNYNVTKSIEKNAPKWENISCFHSLEGRYEGLGIDREAACLGVNHGIVIDAGSAITVDVMENSIYKGGWIWPGLKAVRDAYMSISKKLDFELDPCVSYDRLPKDTKSATSYAIFTSIKLMVNSVRKNMPITITGGDADIFSKLFPCAIRDEKVVFKGMKIMIKDNVC